MGASGQRRAGQQRGQPPRETAARSVDLHGRGFYRLIHARAVVASIPIIRGMNAGTWVATSGTLTLHALMLGAALSLVGQQAAREFVRPVEVVLLAPAPPPPAPVARTVPEPAPEPVKQVAPEPPPPPPVEAEKPRPRRAATPARRAAPAPEPAQVAPPPAARPATIPAPASIAPPPMVAPVAPAPPTAIATAPANPVPRDPAPTAQAMPAQAPLPPAREATIGGPRAGITPGVASVTRTTPKFDASWVGNAPPPYPTIARRLGEEGEVRLDVHVGSSGRVLDVRLKRSSGSPVLDQTAIDTVKKWRFRPATVDGQPVAEWYHDWKWVFKLES